MRGRTEVSQLGGGMSPPPSGLTQSGQPEHSGGGISSHRLEQGAGVTSTEEF